MSLSVAKEFLGNLLRCKIMKLCCCIRLLKFGFSSFLYRKLYSMELIQLGGYHACQCVFSSGNVKGLIVPTGLTERQFTSEPPDSKEIIMPVLDLSVPT